MDEDLNTALDTTPAATAAPTAPASTAPAAPTEKAPETAVEAMTRAMDRSRDELGRFTAAEKAAADAAKAAAPATAAAPAAPGAVDPNKPAKAEPEDPLAMPEGLGEKAQQRFQTLVHANKELSTRAETAEQQVAYVRDTFQQHGIRQDQFEQAAGVIGALNRGDFAAAQQMLMEQLRQVSLMSGQPVAGVDALAEFPDLREKVNGFQIGEAEAMEVARLRKMQAAIEGRHQTQQRTMQEQQAQRAAVDTAKAAVNDWTLKMQAQDIDWPTIEAELLPEIGNLLRDVSPEKWLPTLQTHYTMLKRAATKFRGQGQPEPSPLRPAAAGAIQRPPTTALEAMKAAIG